MTYDNQVKNRLKRIEGQVRGVLKMMDEQKDCKEVVAQLSAIRSAVDRAIAVVVSANLEHCIRKDIETGSLESEKLIQEAVELLVKSR
ncbi:metal-sensitive transcriptional regulator [Anoxybacillus sp. LAT_35]|nr:MULTISPECIES: metal-sensitive transcriptional regulator [Anoxybacillus]AST07285.1 cytoplasmic protein [Anoxybacillus flavithermus]MCG6196351.1 metal-sensitive transcriptional regulator [Anoxybacillus sp. LAT_38]QAV26739.1 metal-sensitive transcriptional regulator [Neobacillus thermocopriae]MCG3084332.1 metal-sensitive transcriptional regulator [Anoxybacillus sp. LAT27]MCG5026333.1 metal-sensitive transcriptional regulator [Anoxybacillus flavithermus]